MSDIQLKDKAINIKGKDYVQVKDRVIYFNENYPNGMIQTMLVSDGERVVFSAKVTPNVDQPERYFTGTSASNPSKGIEAQVPHEVAETSAVGRALALMGIGVIDSIASVDEMHKVNAVGAKSQLNTSKPSSNVICQYHKVAMFKTPNMKDYAHRDEVRGWCNGKGYKDELDAWREQNKEPAKEKLNSNLAQEVAGDVPF